MHLKLVFKTAESENLEDEIHVDAEDGGDWTMRG